MSEAPVPPQPAPAAPLSPTPAPRAKWPWIVGGCGCLVVLAVIALFVVFFVIGVSANKASQQYNPYRGDLAALLPKEMSTGNIKFTFSGSSDRLKDWTEEGATAALGFTYQQTAAGAGVPVDGALCNFPSSAEAQSALSQLATKQGATLEAKAHGQRFTANKGGLVAWTNGSLLCVATSKFERPAQNFEAAAKF
jgi:hypothetical protein